MIGSGFRIHKPSGNKGLSSILATKVVELEGPPARRSKFDRYCWECGKKVCSYKDPEVRRVYCYEHDHLQPWTYESLVGNASDRHYQKRLTDNGKGRGNWKDKEGYDVLRTAS